jgi:hypothetical protein
MPLVPGAEGQPLPSNAEVFRLCRATNDNKLGPEAFHLSTADKEQPVPRLSVWETTNTTVEQADTLTNGKNALAGFLLVAEIRQLRPEPDHAGVVHLDVEWEPAREGPEGNRVVSSKPGAQGHCGITRLDQDRATDGTALKTYRKSLYGKLARLANARPVQKFR